MKKLIFMTLVALTFGAFGITADEAYASKNYYVIGDYCKTNKINSIHFIVDTNKASFVDYKMIYDSATNKVFNMKFWSYSYYDKANCDTLQYEYNKSCHRFIYKEIKDKSNGYIKNWVKQINDKYGKKHVQSSLRYEYAKEDMTKSTWYEESVVIASKWDNAFGNDVLKDILYPRVTNVNVNAWISLAVAYDDVDKIIDALLCADDTITPELAEAVIKPINAVANDYRKADILTALINLNSRCTIKLYDDQKTWEPILAKIRAMISVRK